MTTTLTRQALQRIEARIAREREERIRAMDINETFAPRTYLSPEQVAEIRRLLQTGASKRAIAQAVKCSPFSVRQYAKEAKE